MYENEPSFGLSTEHIKGIVYLYTNKINGKVYIGQTIDEYSRKIKHKVSKDNYPFHCAIRKYGWDNFEYKVLFRVSEKIRKIHANYKKDRNLAKQKIAISLNALEIYYIRKYKSTDSNYGYNICTGGTGTHGCLYTANIPVLKFSMKGKFLEEYDSLTDAAKSIIDYDNLSAKIASISCVCSGKPYRRKILVSRFGFRWAFKADWENGIANLHLDRVEDINLHVKKNAKPLARLSIDEKIIDEFPSITDAAKEIIKDFNVGLYHACSKISAVCEGRKVDNKFINSAFGYKWCWKENIGKPLPKINPTPNYLLVKVAKFNNKTGEFIEIFDSATEAAKSIVGEAGKYNASSSIIKCCKGKQHKSYGFKWKYLKDCKLDSNGNPENYNKQ